MTPAARTAALNALARSATLTASLWTITRDGDSDHIADATFTAPRLTCGRLDLDAMLDAAARAVDLSGHFNAPLRNKQLLIFDGDTLIAKRRSYHGMSSWSIEPAASRALQVAS